MKHIFKNFIVTIITWEAKLILKKYKPKIVGVTGSVGKTSAKDAIYTVLASTYKTRKSEKSFNSEVGVPLTILGVPNGWSNPFIWLKNIIEGLLMIILPFEYPQWLVLEVGADKPKDIQSIASWLKPDIAVITHFGKVPVHVEFFPSIEDLIKEKLYLAESVKQGGTLVLNYDDDRIQRFAETSSFNKISYGTTSDTDVYGSHESIEYGLYENSEIKFPQGLAFRVNYNKAAYVIHINNALGKQHMYPVLAAFAVGVSQKISPEIIGAALNKHETPKGRMKLIPGIKDTLIIDDSYNSSPIAVQEALRVLEKVKAPFRKIAVLGDMLELGDYSIQEHKKSGELAAEVANILVTVGIRSRGTADAALNILDESDVLQFEDSREAGKYLEGVIREGDIILVKGSQRQRMERIIEELMRHPDQKEKLLVRQESAWLAK